MTVTILKGDCIEVMRTMEDESVDCAVTSPPYWGLRDYGVEGQMGLEPTLGEHLQVMVDVFREVRRILKPSGTVWLNYGDCYASSPNGRKADDIVNDDRRFRDKPFSTVQGFLKPKDLCLIPARLAIALQEDGWWIRSKIIWSKPNPMPESVKDRPANAYEEIFLLTKSERYFYDHEAVRVPRKSDEEANGFRGGSYTNNQPGKRKKKGNYKVPTGWDTTQGSHGTIHRDGKTKTDKQRGHGRRHAGFNERWDSMSKEEQQSNGANLKNVWEISPQGFNEAHFATFPPKLAETCIKAGCPPGGVVFDPFGGAGTTGLVADQLQRDAILIELNQEYIDIAQNRIMSETPLFTEVKSGQEKNNCGGKSA